MRLYLGIWHRWFVGQHKVQVVADEKLHQFGQCLVIHLHIHTRIPAVEFPESRHHKTGERVRESHPQLAAFQIVEVLNAADAVLCLMKSFKSYGQQLFPGLSYSHTVTVSDEKFRSERVLQLTDGCRKSALRDAKIIRGRGKIQGFGEPYKCLKMPEFHCSDISHGDVPVFVRQR